MKLVDYDVGDYYDEMYDSSGNVRPSAKLISEALLNLSPREFSKRQKDADLAFLNMGITFGVYGDERGTERTFPFDLIPRIIEFEEWDHMRRGLEQRVRAINAFVNDVYHQGKILDAGIVPEHVVRSSQGYLKACEGLVPPRGIWTHVSGIDLVRHKDGQFYVLEDNVRCPSGVSYVLENRQVSRKVLPELFLSIRPLPVKSYPQHLLQTLSYLTDQADPTIVVLTPGRYNSAYFEHSYLAQQMGVELVENTDLIVQDDAVMMRTTKGLQRVDVIYARVNAEFLDPMVFRADSVLGVPGLMNAYRSGNVALANAPGTGIADDKAVYPYVPKMIEYYLEEKPVLPNVPTYVCWDADQRQHVLEHLDEYVVKATNESGGYGMLVGPHASKAERERFAKRIENDPRNYVAQPTISLSRVPTFSGGTVEGRHVDLRPYVLYGNDVYVQPGGLTRVALRKGSLVVNSSQGGGSKDTWVLAPQQPAGRPHNGQGQSQKPIGGEKDA